MRILYLYLGISLVSWLTIPISALAETRAYIPAMILGREGQEEGLFRQPNGIVADDAGRLYVADTYNHRIQVFEADGRFVEAFGAPGTRLGMLSHPKDLAWGPDQVLYVADTENHRIQAFNRQGKVVLALGSFGNQPGQFHAPEGVAVDAQRVLYVVDTQNHRVQKFAADGTFLLSWGGSGSGRGEFLSPTDIALDRDGRVLVADTQNHRVQAFTADGHYLWEIGSAGHGAAEFDSPRGLTTDQEGHIYVADTNNSRVQIFDPTGRYLSQVGRRGKGSGEFHYPAALWVDPQRMLYVADTTNDRVQLLTYVPALAWLEQGWQAFRATRLDDAVAAWNEALQLDSSLAEAHYGLGLAHASWGQYDIAIEHLHTAIGLHPKAADARWALYRTYLGQLTLPLLIGGLITGSAVGTLIVPRLRRRVLREQGRRLLAEGRIHDTITIYERLLRFDRDNLEVCKVLDNLYEREGLEGKRKQVNESIARLEPDNLQALSYLGQHQFAERRFAEAQQTWERILQQQPEWPEARFYLAAVRAERGQVEAALDAFHQALSLVIESYQPLAAAWRIDAEPPIEVQLAAILEEKESILKLDVPYAQALASFRQARHMLARQYIRQGQEHLRHHGAAEALPHLRWANALDPANALASSLLKQVQISMTFDQGLRYYQAEEYVQALRCFRETLALDAEHEQAKRYLRYAQQCLEGGVSERFRHLDLGHEGSS
ncbi:MAG TPA: 6-bladed beta-propeller [Alphaproteobacteria bacterium]|nr:6-bladed beta-propeller [Alphaproteobacteria bacterium]